MANKQTIFELQNLNHQVLNELQISTINLNSAINQLTYGVKLMKLNADQKEAPKRCYFIGEIES